MELKDMIAKVEEKLTGAPEFKEEILKNPLKAVEDLLGIKVPTDTLGKILEAVKEKVDIKDVAELLKGAGDKEGGLKKAEEAIEGVLGGLFHKK